MAEPITDQQLADELRARWPNIENTPSTGIASGIIRFLRANPPPIALEAGKLYEFKDRAERYAIGPHSANARWWWFELINNHNDAVVFEVSEIVGEAEITEVAE